MVCASAVAPRFDAGRGRQNFFTGLVMFSRRLPRFDRQATGKQTMPGSVKQLPPPARIEPERWDRD